MKIKTLSALTLLLVLAFGLSLSYAQQPGEGKGSRCAHADGVGQYLGV